LIPFLHQWMQSWTKARYLTVVACNPLQHLRESLVEFTIKMRLCVVRSFIRISTEKRVLSTIQSYRLMILDGTLRNMSYMFMLCVVMRTAFVRVSFVHECFDVYVIRAYAHMCARHDVCGCMCVYIYVYMYTCIFVHKCIYVCIHICMLYCLCACVWFNDIIYTRENTWCKWHTRIYESIQHVQDTCKKRSINANNATHYVKLGKKRRESSQCNCSIMSPRVMIKAIIIIVLQASRGKRQRRVLRDFEALPLEKVSHQTTSSTHATPLTALTSR